MKMLLPCRKCADQWPALLLMMMFLIPVTSCQKGVSPPENSLKPHDFSAAMRTAGNRTVQFPAEDPGPPLYARVSPLLNQIFRVNGYVVIPFYRNPAGIRPDFNLVELIDAPAAFGTPLTCTGQFVIERNAPLGTFPIIVQTRSNNLPFWLVAEAAFDAAAADGVMTIGELEATGPIKATATRFEEMLRPRLNNHHVVITASGRIDATGAPFQFQVNHPGDMTRSISLKL